MALPPVTALSLWQPWASLVALGAKTIETRSWSTKYRGPLLIHAARREPEWGRFGDFDSEPFWRGEDLRHINDCECADGEVDQRCGRRSRHRTVLTRNALLYADLPLGAIVASCRLVDVVPMIDACGTDVDAPAHLCRSGDTLLLHRPESDPFHDGETERDVSDQAPFGDFAAGRFAWLLDAVTALAEPIPARGHQGLWGWTT